MKLWTLPALFLASLAFAQEGGNAKLWMGKTSAQVVSMGRQKWFEAYTKKHGESTLEMANAERGFGYALFEENQKVIMRRSKPDIIVCNQLRSLMTRTGTDCISAARGLAGGGSMFTLFEAGVGPDVEEAIRDFIFQPANGVMTTDKEVKFEFNRAIKDVSLHAKEIDQNKKLSGTDSKTIIAKLKNGLSLYESSMAAIASRTAKQKAGIRNFFMAAARGVTSEIGD